MIKSMTGYGSAKAVTDKLEISVEMRSVNNRYLDCSVKLPRVYVFAEDAIKSQIQKGISRGKVDVFITVASVGDDALTVTVNEELAKSYFAAMERLSQLGGDKIKNKFSVTDIARFSDVLTVEKREEDPGEVKDELLRVLEEAVADFNAMRAREGERLYADISARADEIERLVGLAEERSPQTVKEYRDKLEARLKEILESSTVDETRLVTEAAIFADKTAVAEETVRLRSHIGQLRELISSDEPVGRKLDFLVQEFNREANTIGSKGNDLTMARIVVDLKAEIEKIREQIQNVE